MDHALVHFEIPADNVEALAKFYTDLLGWKITTDDKYPGYWGIHPVPSKTGEEAMKEGILTGGMMQRKLPGQMPTNYVLVESVADYLAKAVALGAQEIVGKTELPDMGCFAVLLDPQNNPLGLFEMMKPCPATEAKQ